MHILKLELKCLSCDEKHQLTLNTMTAQHKWKREPIPYGDLWEIVVQYKKLKGYDTLPNWDRQYKGRALKRAGQIYRFFKMLKEPVEVSQECLEYVHQRAEREHWTWTLETVVKMAPDWLVAKQKGRV